jgi:hypothetical protein
MNLTGMDSILDLVIVKFMKSNLKSTIVVDKLDFNTLFDFVQVAFPQG